MTGDFCVSKFFRRRMEVKHLMCLESKTSVFKVLRVQWTGRLGPHRGRVQCQTISLGDDCFMFQPRLARTLQVRFQNPSWIVSSSAAEIVVPCPLDFCQQLLKTLGWRKKPRRSKQTRNKYRVKETSFSSLRLQFSSFSCSSRSWGRRFRCFDVTSIRKFGKLLLLAI